MYYGSQEERQKAAQSYIRHRREAAALYPVITKIFKHFDGKVYNCRLEKALRETGERIFCCKRYKWIEIYVYNCNEQITLAQMEIDKLTDGKRIPAELLIQSARDRRESLLKDAAEMENAMQHVEEIKARLAQLAEMKAAILKDVPYRARDIFDIK